MDRRTRSSGGQSAGTREYIGRRYTQDCSCLAIEKKLPKCLECAQGKSDDLTVCRFKGFRKIKTTKFGGLATAGFCQVSDCSEEDLQLWQPGNQPPGLNEKQAIVILEHVGAQFCSLLKQENVASQIHVGQPKTMAWKPVAHGVREMCDVCETSLFNFHWICRKCGFMACIKCYTERNSDSVNIWSDASKETKDQYGWLHCSSRVAHKLEHMMLTQIVAGDSLAELGKRLHEVQAQQKIPQYCGCFRKEKSHLGKVETDGPTMQRFINALTLSGIQSEQNIAANEAIDPKDNLGSKSINSWLTDYALFNNNGDPFYGSWLADFDAAAGPKVQELLIQQPNRQSPSPRYENSQDHAIRMVMERNVPSDKMGGKSTLNWMTNEDEKSSDGSCVDAAAGPEVQELPLPAAEKDLDNAIRMVVEQNVPSEEIDSAEKDLKYFVRRFACRDRNQFPSRVMTLGLSKLLYPDVPHMWLCEGRLLRLIDPTHPGNLVIFQDQWKRGQPVIISGVSKLMDQTLWTPESFSHEFGLQIYDFINCVTGNVVPQQPMHYFWNGYEYISKQLKNATGKPMVLKLKDWPPGQDFAELLPSRFEDLMRVLPMPDYTLRSGNLNLPTWLPDCFVRPDLGPKMYNAYGSALVLDKGTTNLHLDISDAVNVMVYVGIPKDGDGKQLMEEALEAINEAGCDPITQRRVREQGEMPGALWHIYEAKDTDKIRDLLNKTAVESGVEIDPNSDPIHDQGRYLDGRLRNQLYSDYGVHGYAIVQFLGDSVFIPAGAPHQVRNLLNSMKIAEDFVSPENVGHCFHLTEEFRVLSNSHTNHEDKVQIKNLTFHAIKNALAVLWKPDNE